MPKKSLLYPGDDEASLEDFKQSKNLNRFLVWKSHPNANIEDTLNRMLPKASGEDRRC